MLMTGYIGAFIGTDNDNKIDFITDLGRRLTTVSEDPLETTRLFQRLSIYAHNFLTPSRFEALFTVNLPLWTIPKSLWDLF